MIEEITRREVEMQSTLMYLDESEKRCEDLQQQNTRISEEALIKGINQMKEKNAELDKIRTHISSCNKLLKEANEKLVSSIAEQDAKYKQEQKNHESQMAAQKQKYNKIEQKLLAEKAELAHQLEVYKELQKVIIINMVFKIGITIYKV